MTVLGVHSARGMSPAALDSLKEAVKDVLSVPDLLEACGIDIDDADRQRRSVPCPIHKGDKPTGFSWTPDGRVWQCWTDDCGKGDIITLLRKLKGWDYERAVKALAQLAKKRGVTIEKSDPAKTAARNAARAARSVKPTATREQVESVEERVWLLARTSAKGIWVRRCWGGLSETWWLTGETRCQRGETYLRQRGLAELIGKLNYWDIVYSEDGSPCIPIYGLERVGARIGGNPMINIATRWIRPRDPERKVTNMKGYPATGTFGESYELRRNDALGRLVLVEGVFDYLSAKLLYRDQRDVLVLGAPGATMLSTIIERLGDDADAWFRAKFRSLAITLVEHPDVAGQKAAANVRAAASARGMVVEPFDLKGAGDLNDFICRSEAS